jgi:enoyl-[acyl-carrier protein] reductase I
MGFLAGKRLLITGLLNNRSIAYGVAKACHREGAELAFSYQGERFKERAAEYAAEFGSNLTVELDVASDEQIIQAFKTLGEAWGQFDGFVHAIAFAPRDSIGGDFLDGLSRESFRVAHDISAYSFPAMAKAALPYLRERSSLVTMSYLGAVRRVPDYNTMGLAKASLEASVRYLAHSLGERNMRVNGVSAGPIKTLAASGIGNFGKKLTAFAASTPIRRLITVEDVGNVTAFLLSDLAAGVSAEVMYVDGGFSHMTTGSSEG